MHTRTVGRFLLALALIGAFALPAAAQSKSKVDISAGYLYLRDITGKTNIPKGFFVGVNSKDKVAFAAELDGSFKSGVKQWTFLGGPRFNGTGSGQAKPFGQVLAGISHATFGSLSTNAFTLAPGGGVDITGKGSKVAARIQAAFDLYRNSGVWSKGFSLGVGVSFGAGK